MRCKDAIFKGDKGTVFNYNGDFSGEIIVKDVLGFFDHKIKKYDGTKKEI